MADKKPTKKKRKKKTQGSTTTYSKHLVSYFDVLGFRNIVSHSSAEEVYKLLHFFDSEVKPFALEDPNEIRCYRFSDHVVRAIPLETELKLKYPHGELFGELYYLLIVQARLAHQGVFVRGVVTIGDLYADEDLLFGPALVAAYDLEVKAATYPRIVIDTAAFDEHVNGTLLRAAQHDLADEVNYVQSLVTQGDDGLTYIDYIQGIKDQCDDWHDYFRFVEAHRDHVVKGLQEHRSLNSTFQKYLWLANWHNRVVRNLTDAECAAMGAERNDLLVPVSMAAGLYFLGDNQLLCEDDSPHSEST